MSKEGEEAVIEISEGDKSSSDNDLSWEAVMKDEENSDAPMNEPAKRTWFDEAYDVFSGYAQSRFGVYFDTIKKDLRVRGVVVNDHGDLSGLFKNFNDYLDYEYRKEERRFIFSFRGREEEVVVEEPKKKKRWWIVGVVLPVFILSSLVTASLVQSHGSDERMIERPKEDVAKQIVATTMPLPQKVSEPKSVEEMIERGLYSSALKTIGKGDFEAGKIKNLKALINRGVVAKYDSLSLVIDSLANKGEYEKAFALENDFDKDVFQLKGNGTSKSLRSQLLTLWVYSYKGEKDKEGAMRSVTEKVREITGKDLYRVIEKDKKFYLEYGS